MVAFRNNKKVTAKEKAEEIAKMIGGRIRIDSDECVAIIKDGELVAGIFANDHYDKSFTAEAQKHINKWCIENNYKK